MADNLPEPKSRKESYLAKAAGMSVTIPEAPESRTEQYLAAIAEGGGGGGGTTYTAGDNIQISADNVISATDTTYSAFTGATSSVAGSAGLVPAPTTADTDKFLKGDGTWDTAGGGGPTVVQTTGTSTTDVMSQNAVTKMIYPTNETKTIDIGSGLNRKGCIAIGKDSQATGASALSLGWSRSGGLYSIAIGRASDKSQGGQDSSAKADGSYSIAIGSNSYSPTGYTGSIALGSSSGSNITASGMMDIGTSWVGAGYNSSNYRLLTGLYDPQSAHDAATKGYVDGTAETYTIATSDWSALSASSPYDYQATVTATYTIGANTIAELLNDSPVEFATYGFAIGSISSQSVTIYSIGQPSASVSLKVNYKG